MHQAARRTWIALLAWAISALILSRISTVPIFAGDPPPTDRHSFAPVASPRPPAPRPQPRVTARSSTWPQSRSPAQTLTNHSLDPVDLKLLVIAAPSDEVVLDAIQAFLDRIGVPYDTLIAAQTPLVSSMLWDGSSHGYYQGILLTTGSLVYDNAGVPTSALTSDQWQTLWDYEAMFRVRQATWFTSTHGYPDAYGLAPVSELDTTNDPLTTRLTAAGQDVFSYLNPNAAIPLERAYTYLGTVISPTVTTPLVVTADGYAIASITRYPDGRENIALTASHSRYSMHSLLLSYGVINWVCRGIFVGERHVSLDIQVDDILLWDSLWDTVNLTTNDDIRYRPSGSDFDAAVNWQSSVRSAVPSAATLTLDMAFNGVGMNPDPALDPSLPPRVIADQGHFNWISHTYDHQLLDTISSSGTITELVSNDNVATQVLALEHYNKSSLVQPAVSGLYNPDFMSGAAAFGIRYLISDAFVPGWDNPSPNAGIYSAFQPSILILPRHYFNVWYDDSTPAELASEYNYYYGPTGTHYPYYDHNLSYAEILDKESDVWLRYLLHWDIDPLGFHQPNLRAYDGTHSLLSDLVDATLAKYTSLYSIPIRNVGMHELGGLMANRMTYNASGAGGRWTRCSNVTVTANHAALVPVTGIAYGSNTESYGGQSISYVLLGAGGTVAMPFSAPCQTIAFQPIADRTILDPAFAVNATASSGLPVSLSASGDCTIVGTIVSTTGLGTCTIMARQAGNLAYDPAADVAQTFGIVRAPQTISFYALPDRTILDSPFSIATSASSGLAVSYIAEGSCTVAGNVVTLVGLGNCLITAEQAGNGIYAAAQGVQRSFNVVKARSTLLVTASSNAFRAGQSITLTATVAPATRAQNSVRSIRTTATGWVTFVIDGSVIGSQSLDANGMAMITVSRLDAGIHHIIVTYSGDANLLGASASLDLNATGYWYFPFVSRRY